MDNFKVFSSKHEKAVADYLGWSVVTGSGSRPGALGDVCSHSWLGECKTHTRPNTPVTFTYAVWRKIEKEASSVFKFPALFCDDGTQEVTHTWCMLSAKQLPVEVERPKDFFKSSSSMMSFKHFDLVWATQSGKRIMQVLLGGEPMLIMSLAQFKSMFCEGV